MEHIWTNKVKLIANQARVINLYKIIDVLGENINTLFKPFKPRIKSYLLFAGIIRSLPFSPR